MNNAGIVASLMCSRVVFLFVERDVCAVILLDQTPRDSRTDDARADHSETSLHTHTSTSSSAVADALTLLPSHPPRNQSAGSLCSASHLPA